MSTAVGIFFGTPFVVAGIFGVLLGLQIVNADEKLNVPHWVMLPIGGVFAFGGFFVWWRTWLQYRTKQQHEQRKLQYPNDPARSDYEWTPDGARSKLSAKAIKATVTMAVLVLFLTPFNYLSFQERHPMLIIITGIFDLITLFVAGHALLLWSRALKFGQSVLRFSEFPFRLGRSVRLTWVTPSGCSGAATGSFTLRAIREWYETSGSGKSRNTQLVHEQQWAGAWELDTPARLTPGMTVDLNFDIPSNAPGTNLQADQPLFWELEIMLRLPGFDFKDTYLVPIYS